MTNGIIYITTGRLHTEEALVSAASVRRYLPEMPITLFSDLNITSEHIDRVIPIENPAHGLRDKVQYMRQTPYDRTLFLDSDTLLCMDISEIFTLLDRFEIAAVHESGHQGHPVANVPDSFPEYNSGVLLYRRSKRVLTLFANWLAQYDAEDWTVRGRHFDQPALRKVLYESDLAIGTLTSQYNCRFLDGGFIAGPVKILHRRSAHDLHTVARILNKYQGQRAYIGNKVYKKQIHGRFLRRAVSQEIGTFSKPWYQLARERIQKYIRQYGIIKTIKKLAQRIFKPPSQTSNT